MTDTAAPESAAKRRPPVAVVWAALTLGLAAILVALLALFVLPALKSGPHDLPVGIVGSDAQARAVESALAERDPGAFLLERYDSGAALDEAVRTRAVAGGLDLTSADVRTVVASAGSAAISGSITAAISGSITAAGNAAASAAGVQNVIDDVVPLPQTDPTGVGVGGLAFPLVFGGIVPAVAFRALLPGRRGWILAGLIGFSAVGGVIVAAMLRFVFGSIEHSFWPVAGAVALGIAALAVPLAALSESIGNKGFTIAAMLMMFVGNPFAGISTSAAWLPAGVAVIGQALPPGAAGTLVRASAYFGGAGGATALVTLVVWVTVGLALWFAAPANARRTTTTAAAAA